MYLGYDNGSLEASVNDTVTATLDWVDADGNPAPNPPDNVIVDERTHAVVGCGSLTDPISDISANDGQGDPFIFQNPARSGYSTSGIASDGVNDISHYSVYDSSSGSVTLPARTLSASIDCSRDATSPYSSSVNVETAYEVIPYSVTLDIVGGIGPTSTKHFLIGQFVFAALNTDNLPGMSTDTYHWSVAGGKPFDNYAAFTDHATYYPLFSTQPNTNNAMSCYFAKPDRATFTCQANLVGLPVTLTRDVLLEKPSAELSIDIGTVDDLPNSTNPAWVQLRRIRDYTFPTGDAQGIEYTGEILTPSGFDGYEDVGQWNWTQLVTSYRQMQQGGIWNKIAMNVSGNNQSIYGIKCLDTAYPYDDWYPADGTANGCTDSPAQKISPD